MSVTLPVGSFQKGENRTLLYVGHAGEDWGSVFPSAAWMPQFNLSLVIGINNGAAAMGMNTSLTYMQNQQLPIAAYCLTGDLIYRFRGQPGISCIPSEGGQISHDRLSKVKIPRARK